MQTVAHRAKRTAGTERTATAAELDEDRRRCLAAKPRLFGTVEEFEHFPDGLGRTPNARATMGELAGKCLRAPGASSSHSRNGVSQRGLRGVAFWILARRRFVRARGTWPEDLARVVASELEKGGVVVCICKLGERPQMPKRAVRA